MTTKSPSRSAEQFVVRFPDGMRDKIAEAAKAAGRSMNAEIVQRLEHTLSEPHTDTRVAAKHRYLVATLDLSHAAKFISSALRSLPEDYPDRQGMSFFIKKYLLPEELEAALEAEYKSGVNDAIREILEDRGIKPQKKEA